MARTFADPHDERTESCHEHDSVAASQRMLTTQSTRSHIVLGLSLRLLQADCALPNTTVQRWAKK